MKIQGRLNIVILAVFVAVSLFIVIQRNSNLNKNGALLAGEVKNQEQQITADLESEGQLLKSLQVDYSFWDSMVSLAQDNPANLSKVNNTFAQQNIDTALPTFKADAAWVYNTDGKLVYSAYKDSNSGIGKLPVSDGYFKKIRTDKSLNYYINTPKGYLEVRATTLVPGSDTDHKTPAKGYWIVARYLGKDFISSISKLSQSNVVLATSKTDLKNSASNSTVKINHDLLNWDGSDSLYLTSSIDIAAIDNINKSFRSELILIGSLAILLVTILTTSIYLIVLRPLKKVTDSIVLNKPSLIEGVIKSSSEFGTLARTIKEFFAQKAKIEQTTADLTKANEALKQQDSVKNDFISMISHQLGTPLAVMDGFLTLVVQGFYGKTNEKMQDALEKTLSRTRNMKGLVFDLLNMSRMTAGKFFLEISDVDMSKVVSEEIEELQRQAHDRNVKLNYHPPEHAMPTIKADEPKTRQAILNLINNAIYYSPNGTVDVYLDSDSSNVIFKVEDTGIGVPDEEKEHLFTKFFRADNARKESPNGTGIGLYLVKRVITDHHGKLIFSSQVGKGSVFGFSLPISGANEPNSPEDIATHKVVVSPINEAKILDNNGIQKPVNESVPTQNPEAKDTNLEIK